MQRIIWSAVLMVFGVLMVVGAGFGMTDSVVKCGGEVMQPGDICEGKTRSGQVTQKTFEETRADSKAGTIMGVVIGVVIIGLGGLSLRVGIRNHRRGPAQPVGQPPVWGPGHQRGQETAQPQWGPSPGQPQQQWNQAPPQQPRWGPNPGQPPQQQWNPQQPPPAQQPWGPQPPQGQQPPPPGRGS